MSTATDLLKNLNGNTYNASTNPYGLDGVGGMDANLVAGFNAMGTAGDEVAAASALAVPAATTATNAATTATNARDQAVAAANTAASLVLVKQPSEIAGIDPCLDFVFSASTAVPSGVITGSSGKWVTGPNGLLTSVAAGTCPIDYDPITGALRGVLVEEARTNLALRSQDLASASWIKQTTVSTTSDTTTAPDGTVTADTVTAGNNGDALYQSYTTSTATTYTVSVWMKMASGSRTVSILMNLVGGGGYLTQSVTVTTTWQRFSFTRTATAGLTSVDFGVLALTGSVICWGVQLEVGAFATSYIPTAGSTVTRAADVNTLLLSSVPWWNASEGTIYVEAMAPSLAANYPMYASLNDGTANNSISIYKSASGSGAIVCDAMAGGVSQSYLGVGAVSAGATFKAAFSFKAGAFAASLNGAAAVTGATGSIPAVTRLEIGSRAGSLFANGPIRRIVLFPRAVNSSILPLLTA